jgi:type VI secretion system FHA domain protein
VRIGAVWLLLSWEQVNRASAPEARSQPVRKERAEPVRAPAPSLDDVLGGFGLAEEEPAAAPAADSRALGPHDDPLGGQFNFAPARPAPQAPPRDVGSTAGDHSQPQLESFRYHGPAPQPAEPLFEIPPSPPPAPPAAEVSVQGDRLIAAFLAGAGLAGGDLDGEIDENFFRDLGAAFAAMAEGFRVLLAARALVKDHAGVERTMIRATDNNPLKYSINAREAVMALIAPRGTGYLSPLAAVEAALRDLKAHEIAVLDGMRAALQGLLDRFDPTVLERRLEDDSSLSVLLQGGKRARLWELYTERYAEIAEAARRRYLGDFDRAFKDAYERKIRDVRSEGGANLR